MSAFSFPIIRCCNVYRTSEELELAQAEDVASKVKAQSESGAYIEALNDVMGKANLNVVQTPTKTRDAHQDLWEGWVAQAPAFEFLVQSNGKRYKLRTRYSAVACTEPNHSKVWASLLLLAHTHDGHDEWSAAVNLSRDDVLSFFERFEGLAEGLVDVGTGVYKQELANSGHEAGLEPVGSHFIRAVGSDDRYYAKLEKEISEGRIVQLSEEIGRSLQSEQGLKDLLYFVFDKDVRGVDDYRRLLAEKEEAYDKKPAPDDQSALTPFEPTGLQWFGLKYDDSVALYCRQDTASEDMQRISYFGISSEDSASRADQHLTVAADESSSALVKLVSPFL